MRISRREFLQQVLGIGVLVSSKSLFSDVSQKFLIPQERIDLLVARGDSPEQTLRSAISSFGGIEKFVKKDSRVVIKPNAAWARRPEQAATTNPELLAAMVRICLNAGARSVEIWDHTCDNPEIAFQRNGLKEAAEKAGAKVFPGNKKRDYQKIEIPKGKLMKSSLVLNSVLDADVFINMPIAKTHASTELTLSLKNLMGINWSMNSFHILGLSQSIADFSTAIKPNLIILDATRILLTNGPQGPGKVKELKTIVVGTNPVSVDSYAATFFGKRGEEIEHIRLASELGVGEIDLTKLAIKEITV